MMFERKNIFGRVRTPADGEKDPNLFAYYRTLTRIRHKFQSSSIILYAKHLFIELVGALVRAQYSYTYHKRCPLYVSRRPQPRNNNDSQPNNRREKLWNIDTNLAGCHISSAYLYNTYLMKIAHVHFVGRAFVFIWWRWKWWTWFQNPETGPLCV